MNEPNLDLEKQQGSKTISILGLYGNTPFKVDHIESGRLPREINGQKSRDHYGVNFKMDGRSGTLAVDITVETTKYPKATDKQFIMIHRIDPDRSLVVTWLNSDAPDVLPIISISERDSGGSAVNFTAEQIATRATGPLTCALLAFNQLPGENSINAIPKQAYVNGHRCTLSIETKGLVFIPDNLQMAPEPQPDRSSQIPETGLVKTKHQLKDITAVEDKDTTTYTNTKTGNTVELKNIPLSEDETDQKPKCLLTFTQKDISTNLQVFLHKNGNAWDIDDFQLLNLDGTSRLVINSKQGRLSGMEAASPDSLQLLENWLQQVDQFLSGLPSTTEDYMALKGDLAKLYELQNKLDPLKAVRSELKTLITSEQHKTKPIEEQDVESLKVLYPGKEVIQIPCDKSQWFMEGDERAIYAYFVLGEKHAGGGHNESIKDRIKIVIFPDLIKESAAFADPYTLTARDRSNPDSLNFCYWSSKQAGEVSVLDKTEGLAVAAAIDRGKTLEEILTQYWIDHEVFHGHDAHELSTADTKLEIAAELAAYIAALSCSDEPRCIFWKNLATRGSGDVYLRLQNIITTKTQYNDRLNNKASIAVTHPPYIRHIV